MPEEDALERPSPVWLAVKLFLLMCLLAAKPDAFFFGLAGYPDMSATILIPAALVLCPLALIQIGIRLYRRFDRGKSAAFWTKWTVLWCMVLWFYLTLPVASISHLAGFRYWASNNIDVGAVSSWTKTFQPPPAKDGDHAWYDQDKYYEVPPSSLPQCLQPLAESNWHDGRYMRNYRLGPRIFFVRKTRYLHLSFGSGMMGGWGVVIGPGAASKSEYRFLRIGQDAYVPD